MSHARLMSALLALTAVGCWPPASAQAQGIAPVKQEAQAKAGKGKAAAQPAADAKKDPEAAGRLLDSGIKSYESGKFEQAVGAISMALQGGGLPSQKVAKALYYRGAAYRKQGKPAQAIADLKSALWLKSGLSEGERNDAITQHAAAYKEAGLGEAPALDRTVPEAPARAAAASAAAVQTAAEAAPAAPAAAAPARLSMAESPDSAGAQMGLAPRENGASEAAAPAQDSSGGGIGGFFSNLFGGGSQPAPAPAPSAPVTTASTTAPPAPQVSSWSDTTSVKTVPGATARPAAVEPRGAKTAALAAAPAAATKRAGGKYRLEIGSTTSRDEAVEIARRIKAEHAHDLAQREPEIDEGKFGASRYYRVGIGPYGNADEPGRLCAALKAKGVDCLVVTR